MTVIPELVLADPDAGTRLLTRVFGFVPGPRGTLAFGDQQVRLTPGTPGEGGPLDHLALSVPDLDAAAAAMIGRGAQVDDRVTPDGPGHIAEFWGGGVRYLFLQGPEGARIELCQNLAAPQGPGHDHIGLPTADLTALSQFFTGLGAVPAAHAALHRPDGVTEVRFLRLGSSMLELYCPPGPLPDPRQGPWRRLLIAGVTAATGPGGLSVAPV